jgi:hypothetical protein
MAEVRRKCADRSTERLGCPTGRHARGDDGAEPAESHARRARSPLREYPLGYHRPAMADQTSAQPIDQQLQEIGAQLAWVRDYL